MTVQELLDDPSKWTKGALARDIDGEGLEADNSSAVCWCLIGAIQKCYGVAWIGVVIKCMRHLSVDWIDLWNNDPQRSFAEVKSLVTELNI